ncbi:MAG: hypothetical protein HEQ39_09050 [Rhizobacter sp.]
MREKLRTDSLSEAATFRYFLTIMAFDWLQFTLIATTPSPSIANWSAASSWAAFAVTVLGLLYLYRQNGGSKGAQFLLRYSPLSVTVGWKFVVIMLISAALIPMVLSKQSEELVGWSTTTALATINLCMILRIGVHLRSLSRGPNSKRTGST